MPAIFNNYTTRDIFEGTKPWLSEGKYNVTQLDYGVWQERRSAFLANNRRIIESLNGVGLPLNDVAYYYTGNFTGTALDNVGTSFAAWEKIKNITDKNTGNGIIYGWDLETFGDITTAGSIAKGAGVTEIGLSQAIFNGGKIVSSNDYSILIKMEEPQIKYVESIISKYKKDGWSALEDIEQVTLNRISMYRNATFASGTPEYMGKKTFEMVTSIGTEIGRDIGAVEAGLKVLSKHGNKLSDVLPLFKNVLLQGNQENVALGGANTSGFDIKVLRELGFSDEDIQIINPNTADLTMGHRIIAASENITTAELNRRVKNGNIITHTRDSNTVGAMVESLGYSAHKAHVAGPDALATVKTLITQDYYNGKSFVEGVIDAHAKGIQQAEDLKNGVVLLKTGQLDKNAMDQVRIGDETTHNYSISGSYWAFDEIKSGITKFTPEGESEAQDVFVASFKSAATGEEDIEFSKMFASKEDFDSWLSYHGIVLNKENIQQSQIDTQSRYHTLDFGRREYDRFFDTSSPAYAGNHDINGYESLDKYLKAYDAVEKYLSENNIDDLDLFNRKEFNRIKSILEEHGINDNYNQRAFVGMYNKLKEEKDVLKHIRDYAFENAEDNLNRTKIVHDMHEAFLNEMDRNVQGTMETKYHTYTLSDVYSIDLLGSDGQYHTITGDTQSKLASGIRRLYEDTSTKSVASSLTDIQIGLKDLQERDLINKDVYQQINNQLKNDPSLFNASNSVAEALSGIFQPFENRSAVTVYEQVMTNTNNEIDDVIQQRIRNKNIDGMPPSVGLQRMHGTHKIGYNGKITTANNYFNSVGDNIKKILNVAGENATGNMRFTSDLDLRLDDAFLSDLGSKLGYSDTQLGVVAKMFDAKKRNKNGKLEFTPYAINGRKRDGLVSAIISPNEAGNSGYVILSNANHSNKVYELLSGVAEKDLTYNEMSELLDGHASIFELKALHKIQVGEIPEQLRGIFGSAEANSTFVYQGQNTTRYLHPKLNLYITDGILHGGLSEAGTDVLKAFNINGGNAIEAILAGDFKEGSRILKKGIDSAISGQSGSASYQGVVNELGERFRGTNFNNSDLIHGYLFEYGKSLAVIQDHILNTGDIGNDFSNLLFAFNEGLSERIASIEDFTYRPNDAYRKIIESSSWKEFWQRHLNEPLSNNSVIKNAMAANKTLGRNGTFDKTLIELLVDTASTLSVDKNTTEFLQEFKKAAHHFSQNIGETYVNAGYFSAVDPGSLYAYAPGSGINRPVAYQRLHARNMLPEALPIEYLDRTGSVIGSLTVTPNEKAWNELNNLTLPDGTRHSEQVSSITTTFKGLSDQELQANYKNVKENLEKYAKEANMDIKLLEEAFDAQVKAAPSIYGDNIIISSTMATTFNEIGLDTKKLTFDRISRIENSDDLTYTRNKLNSLEGEIVKKGDIIGHDSRGFIYWDGLETKLTRKNIDDILESGEAVMTPLNSIDGRKIFIGGAEKAIANGVVVNDEFLRTHGFANKEQAHKYLDFIFEKVLMPQSGTIGYIPSVGGNLSVAKHLSGSHLQSSMNLIINEYRKAGELEFLAKEMYKKGYKHWFPESSLNNQDDLENIFYNNKFLINTENTPFSFDVINLLNDIKNNNIGKSSINDAISNLLTAFGRENAILIDMQNNVQNQIMGTSLSMNPRLDAVIRRRNASEFYLDSEGGVNGVIDGINGINGKRYEEILLDEMYRTSTSGYDDYIHAGDLGNADSVFNQAMEHISKNKNASLIRERIKVGEQKKVLAGIKEASDFFIDPSILEKRTNMVSITMDELIKEIPTLSKENLKHSIFKPNGEFSDRFIELANQNKVDLNADTLMVAVDLGHDFKVKFSDGTTKTISKIPVPLYSIYDDFDTIATKEEDTFFVRSLGDFMNLFDVYKNNIDNINNLDTTYINNIAKAISRYAEALMSELSTDDKKSLAFKLGGKFTLPNSTFLLGQDEIAAVTEEMLNGDMLDLTNKINNLQQKIRNGEGNSSELLKELSNALAERQNKLKEIGEKIESTGKIELYGNKLTGHAGFTEAANGGFLNINAVNRNTFEQRLGFDIGLFGKSLFEDVKTGADAHYMTMGKRTFNINIEKAEKQIAEELNKNLKDFSYSGDLIQDIENYMVTIRDVNEHLLETKSGKIKYNEMIEETTKIVNQAFDFIGERYLKEIGVTTRLSVRFPAFGIGIGPANIILDDSVGNAQLRIMGPGYSATMNMDQDGDILGIAIHNAANAMKKVGENASEILSTLKIIERNALDDFKIVKDMIVNGEAFKMDNLSDVYYNESIVFKTYDPEGYSKAYDKFLSAAGIDKAQYIEEATDLVAAYSPQMRKAINAYNANHGNFLKDTQAIIAALKAKTTKENIGLISNSSFRLHDAVTIAFSQSTSDIEKKKLATLHSYMDYINLDSSKGSLGMNGLMTIAEQKGIDVKHILNATQINQTNLFSQGMSGLMNINGSVRNNNLKNNMVKIMTSLSHTLFANGDNLQEIAEEVLNTSIDDYTKLIAETNDNAVAKALITRMQLRALYELSNEASVRAAYSSPIRKFKSFSLFKEGLSNIKEYASDSNVASKLIEIYKTTTDAKLELEDNLIYLAGGNLSNENRAYMLTPYNVNKGKILDKNENGKFVLKLKEIDLESTSPSGKYKHFTGSTISEIMDKVNGFLTKDGDNFVSIEARTLKEGVDSKQLSKFAKSQKNARAINILNDLFASGSYDNINKYFERGGNRYYRNDSNKSVPDFIKNLQNSIGEENVKIIDKLTEISEEELIHIQNLRDFIASKDKKVKDSPFNSLIKELNADIINNPQNYAKSTEFLNFKDIVENKLKSLVGNDSDYANYVEQYNAINGNFNSKKYSTIVDFLRDNVYNITEEKETLLKGVEELKGFNSLGIADIDNAIKTIPGSINQNIKKLADEQIKNIHYAESKIYELFDSTKNIDTFFGWNKPASRFTEVGFGEFVGYKFGQLSQTDIDKIFKFAKDNAKYYDNSENPIHKHAYQKTVELLTQWQSQNPAINKTSAIKYKTSKATTEILEEITNLKALGNHSKLILETAEEIAEEKTKKKTLSGALNDIGAGKAKDFFVKNKKVLGIAAASMAAIGIVNNVLHNQKNKSPLTPARRPSGNTTPSYDSPATNETPVNAPLSRQKIIYHDKGSGFNFKVSASTRNYIDDQNNAKLIGMSGGGNPSVYSQSDTSGVTDNWLANKFAELT